MSNRVPSKPRKEIFACTYAKADEHRYLEQSRPENANFIDQLVKDAQIGVRLANYMDLGEVRTYIKDSILNKYSKERSVRPHGIEDILVPIYGQTQEINYRQKEQVSLHRREIDDCLIVVARASSIKWETGLRKLLMYVATLPDTLLAPSLFSQDSSENKLSLAIIIFEHGNTLSESDKRLIEKGLGLINVKVVWA